VTLNVTAASLPTLTASPLSLAFSYQSGGATPAAQNVSLSSSGNPLNYTAASSAGWLTVTPGSGTTPGSLSMSVNPTGLAVGTYTGNVTVSSAGASNASQKITVSLSVTERLRVERRSTSPGSHHSRMHLVLARPVRKTWQSPAAEPYCSTQPPRRAEAGSASVQRPARHQSQ
jgi:hypothetical protein